jgi:hypothetical protein
VPARGLGTGAPFLFKSKAPRNSIVGGGFVSSHLPVSQAWEFGNGEESYARERSGESIALPEPAADRPNREFLTWHLDEVFRAG